MADINLRDIIKLLATDKETRIKLKIHGVGPPPIYIRFGAIPEGMEILSDEFETPYGKCLLDIGSDNKLYGIEFMHEFVF